MAKRQSDYLKSLLEPDTPDASSSDLKAPSPPPSPPRREPSPVESAGSALLGRDSALARIAAGEVRQVTQLQLDPARVRIWRGNARRQAALTEESCRDLIDAILAEGGQKVPAVVRRVADDPAYDYEVIAGTRRHWAVSWLRANSYPEITFLAQVHALDDESAFRLSDIENRARRDVSDFERAVSYREALQAHYGGKQARMAERLRLSPGWLSKMLAVAALPDWAVAAFASPTDIQMKTCYPLAQRIAVLSAAPSGDAAALRAIAERAAGIEAEQAARRASGRPGIGAPEVVQSLLRPVKPEEEAELLFSGDSAHGRRALSVLSSNRNGVTLRLHAGSGATDAELARLFREALASLDRKGLGLRP